MSTLTWTERWSKEVFEQDVQKFADMADGLLHAARLTSDLQTLCEIDGPALVEHGDKYVRLNLDVSTPDERVRVSCPGCREWMHA